MLREELEKEDTPANALLLDEIAKEQERWQALYGPAGKLGFDRNGYRYFFPQQYIVGGDGFLTDIRLRREDTTQDGRVFATGIVESEVYAAKDPQPSREAYFRTVILPNLRAAARR